MNDLNEVQTTDPVVDNVNNSQVQMQTQKDVQSLEDGLVQTM